MGYHLDCNKSDTSDLCSSSYSSSSNNSRSGNEYDEYEYDSAFSDESTSYCSICNDEDVILLKCFYCSEFACNTCRDVDNCGNCQIILCEYCIISFGYSCLSCDKLLCEECISSMDEPSIIVSSCKSCEQSFKQNGRNDTLQCIFNLCTKCQSKDSCKLCGFWNCSNHKNDKDGMNTCAICIRRLLLDELDEMHCLPPLVNKSPLWKNGGKQFHEGYEDIHNLFLGAT